MSRFERCEHNWCRVAIYGYEAKYVCSACRAVMYETMYGGGIGR